MLRGTMQRLRVTTVTVQQTEIRFGERGVARAGSRRMLNRMAREFANGLSAETLVSLGRVAAWLAFAGASALARRAWRASLSAPRTTLPAGAQPELPTSRRALPERTATSGA